MNTDEGFEIPIGGDMSDLTAAFQAVIAAMEKLGARIEATMNQAAAATQRALGPIRRTGTDAAASLIAVSSGARGARTAMGGLIGSISNAGAVIANIVAGASAMRTAFRFLSTLNATSATNALATVRNAVSSIASGFRRLMADPALRRIAIAAAGTAVAIGGIVIATRTARFALSALGSVASSTFAAIRSAAATTASSIRNIGSGGGGGFSLGMPSIAGILGGVGGAFLFASQAKAGALLAGQIEQINLGLTAISGSATTANGVIDEMLKTSLRTGAAVIDQADTVRKFMALGFDDKSALKLNTNLLDISGALGLSRARANELGNALAQVQSKGTVSMEELRQQIAEKGIPVMEILAEKLGVTQSALIELVSAGKVPAKALIDIFLNMEGSFAKFAGGATRNGMTFLGLLDRLQAAWQLLLVDFAAPITNALKPLLTDGLNVISTLKTAAASAGKAVADTLLAAFALIKTGKTMELLGAGFRMAVTGALDVLTRGLRSAVAFLATALPPIFTAAFSKLTDPGFWFGVEALLASAGAAFAAEIKSALPMADAKEIAALRAKSGAEAYIARREIEGAGGVDMTRVLQEALGAAGAAALKAGGGPANASFTAAQQAWQDLLKTVSASVAEMRASVAIPPPPGFTPATTPGGAGPTPDALANAIAPAVLSLSRIGGGGERGGGMIFQTLVGEARTHTRLLREVVRNTGLTTTRTAVYA